MVRRTAWEGHEGTGQQGHWARKAVSPPALRASRHITFIFRKVPAGDSRVGWFLELFEAQPSVCKYAWELVLLQGVFMLSDQK